MQPYQERVVAEKKDLDEKIVRLRTFLIGPSVEVGDEDRELMELQHDAMVAYSEVLGKRIARF